MTTATANRKISLVQSSDDTCTLKMHIEDFLRLKDLLEKVNELSYENETGQGHDKLTIAAKSLKSKVQAHAKKNNYKYWSDSIEKSLDAVEFMGDVKAFLAENRLFTTQSLEDIKSYFPLQY